MTIVAALLAAGGGTRYAGATHKLLARSLAGRSVIEQSVANLIAATIDQTGDQTGDRVIEGPVIVVTGAVELTLPEVVEVRHNPNWASGQASSIQVAVSAAEQRHADFVLIGLGDQPGIVPTAWRAVAAAPPEHLIVVAAYDGRRGPHPVRLHRSLWPMLASTGDGGARTLLRDHPALVHEIDCEGSAFDIDTLEDAQQWRSS